MHTKMYIDIEKRLKSLGFFEFDINLGLIYYIVDKVKNSVKNKCNIGEIPNELHHIVVDMICGEFLLLKKNSGQLKNFDVEAAVKQVQEGDTSVTFAIGDGSLTPEQRLDRLISFLMTNGSDQFVTFRRLKW